MTAPRLRPGVRLIHDPTRRRELLLLPEGVLVLNEAAAAVLARCDGTRTVDAIVAELARQYAGVNAEDVGVLLDRLAERRVVARA